MRAAVIHQHGGPGCIQFEKNFPDPRPGPDDVILRVRACSLNYHDIFTRRGMPGIKIPLPCIMGNDFSGDIVELGANVKDWAVGNRVVVDPIDRVGGGGMIGEMWRDWTYVSDIVAGVLGALDTPRGYEIYNLGCGMPVLMADFVAQLERLAGRKANVRSIPAPASEVVRTGADITKAAAHFGYQPQVSVETGLKLFWEWIAAQ